MRITINDNCLEMPEGTTLEEALSIAGIKPTGIATAVNDTVIARDKRNTHKLSDGDKILIIKAFYGG